jgi:hypothetical protein
MMNIAIGESVSAPCWIIKSFIIYILKKQANRRVAETPSFLLVRLRRNQSK